MKPLSADTKEISQHPELSNVSPALMGVPKREHVMGIHDHCQSWFLFLKRLLPSLIFFQIQIFRLKNRPNLWDSIHPCRAPGCIDPRTAWGSWPFAQSSQRQRRAHSWGSWETERRVPGVWVIWRGRHMFGRYTNKPSMALHGYRINHTIYVNIIYIYVWYIDWYWIPIVYVFVCILYILIILYHIQFLGRYSAHSRICANHYWDTRLYNTAWWLSS